MYNLEQAGKAAGKAKNTIRSAILRGRLSATQTPTGRWQIDPAELHRVYPSAKKPARQRVQASDKLTDLIDMLQQERQREREQYESTIRDLRQRLDRESEERAKLTLMLTDQRPRRRPTLFERLFGA